MSGIQAAIMVAPAFVIVGIVMMIMVKQIKDAHLPRNGAFGIRTTTTKRSDQAWAAGHEAAAPLASLSAWLCFTVGLLALILGSAMHGKSGVGPVYTTAAAGFVAVSISFTMMVLRANAAARGVGTPRSH